MSLILVAGLLLPQDDDDNILSTSLIPTTSVPTTDMTLYGYVIAGFVVGIAIILRSRKHNEDALLVDWSDLPPRLIICVITFLAETFRAIADALIPPPVRMLDYATAYQRTMLAYTCQYYRIPDFLATGPKTVSKIAEYMETKNVIRVERLMFALAAEGLTQLDPSMKQKKENKKGQDNEPRFVNTALSATLRSDHPNSMRGFVGHQVEEVYESFGKLTRAFGPEATPILWNLVHPDYSLWQYFEDNPKQEEQFGRAMTAVDSMGAMAMAEDAPFHKFQRIIDIGGSLGHFLHKILMKNPNKSGILFDRPQVIANARPLWFDNDGVYHDGTTGRIQLVEGDFFNPKDIPLAQAGHVYLMRITLHDWNDQDCLQILKNLRQRMMGSDNATLLIGESAMPDRDTVGAPILYRSDMVMLSAFGDALDRTPRMWKELLNKAGFDIVALHPTRALAHFIEAIPCKNVLSQRFKVS